MSCSAKAMSMQLHTILKFRANYCILLGYASDLNHWTILNTHNMSWCPTADQQFQVAGRFSSLCFCWQLLFRSNAFDSLNIVDYYDLSLLLAISMSLSLSSSPFLLRSLLSPSLSLLTVTCRVSESFSQFVCIAFDRLTLCPPMIGTRNECAIYVIAMNGLASLKLKFFWKENVREQSRLMRTSVQYGRLCAWICTFVAHAYSLIRSLVRQLHFSILI